MSDSILRELVDLRENVLQKNRIAFRLRLGAIERGEDDQSSGDQQMLSFYQEQFSALEENVEKDIKSRLKDVPIYDYLGQIKGIGPMLAARLIALINIDQCDTVSSLWRFAGYAVIDGHAERRVKGEKLHYSNRLKATCYNVAVSFLKSNSPYRAVYDAAKEHYQATQPEWTDGHRHMAALRKMVKVFLAHLWETWRALENLPIRPLYVMEYLGHTHTLDPKTFGWKEVETF